MASDRTKYAKCTVVICDASAAGTVSVFSPGPWGCRQDGTETIEGPHFPQPHRWYARVEVRDGQIVRVIE